MSGKWVWFPNPERCWEGLESFVDTGSYTDFKSYYKAPDDVYELVSEGAKTFVSTTIDGEARCVTGTYVLVRYGTKHGVWLPKSVVHILDTPFPPVAGDMHYTVCRLSHICTSAVLAMR